MQKYEDKTSSLNYGEIEELVRQYLEKIRAEASDGSKTVEEQKIIDRIREQATF